MRSLPSRLDLAVTLWTARKTQLRRRNSASVELPRSPPIHEAAREFLHNYGGLTLQGRSTIRLQPMACAEDHEHVLRYREIDKRDYYPVGMIDDECATVVLVDDDGSIYLFAAPPGSGGGPWVVGRSLFESSPAIMG